MTVTSMHFVKIQWVASYAPATQDIQRKALTVLVCKLKL